MREQYDLTAYDPEADYIIFDDLPIERVHGVKCWVGSMGEFSDTDKYKPKVRVKWGPRKCCIILCNEGNDWRNSQEWNRELDWFKANVKCVNVIGNLF
jgi:hypothetical protein